MAQQTAVEWLVKTIGNAYKEGIFEQHFCKDIERAKQMEESQIKDAMMYALDEDGHTGEWKRKFVDNYYMSSFLHNKLDKDGFCTD